MIALTVALWHTKTSLRGQIAQLDDEQGHIKSDMSRRMTSLNENVAAKNREIAQLTKSSREDRKKIAKVSSMGSPRTPLLLSYACD